VLWGTDQALPTASGRTPPTRAFRRWVEQVREAEIALAIDRLRLVHEEKRKTVHILSTVAGNRWLLMLLPFRRKHIQHWRDN